TSYLDWAIVEMASPRPVRVVIERDIYQKWYLHWFLKSLNMIPISRSASREAIIEVGKALAQGEVVALFPEGFITRNGHLGHFQRGFELIVKEHPCSIVPFYIHGLWGTMSSYAKRRTLKATEGRLKRVSIAFGAAITKPIDASDLKLKVMDLSYLSWHSYAQHLPSLQQAWLKRAKMMKSNTVLIEGMREVSGYESIALNWSLQKIVKEAIGDHPNVGILLAPSLLGVLANMSLLSLGKVVVNLNYTNSAQALSQSLTKAEIKTVITSKRFLTELQQKDLLPAEVLQALKLIDLDLLFERRSRLKLGLQRWVVKLLPACLLQRIINKKSDPQKVAAVLFKEDTKGLAIGVQLSHRSLMSNIQQLNYSLSLDENDTLLGGMPLYDAMGFTLTFLLPLLEGLPLICYADTNDTVGMAKQISQHKITVLCHTPTIFELYRQNKRCHPLMLQSVRIAISGMEKLSDNAYKAFKEKFDIAILAGYGSTENSAMVSCNLPDVLIPSYWHIQAGQKAGSVGMPMPGTRIKIVDGKTYEELPSGEVGLVLIAGPQLMLGYLDEAEKNAAAFIYIKGEPWYNSGDTGYMDADGFLFVN
ncbi:MAG: AMP-binding protein, partial [Gammaproteobacteria bacterium]|nr:AMP-binding protein [Gammaproteobacteria bacterium]